MDLKRSVRVVVNLKSLGYFTVMCDKVEFVKSKNALCPDYYRFELKKNTVASVPSGLVFDFQYFEKVFDTEPKHFTL